MANIQLYMKCSQCGGDGILNLPDGTLPHPVIVNSPCSACNSTGYVEFCELDGTKIDEIIAGIDYIHGKVTAIWERVKPPN